MVCLCGKESASIATITERDTRQLKYLRAASDSQRQTGAAGMRRMAVETKIVETAFFFFLLKLLF